MEREDMDNIVAASEWKGYWQSLINENTALREELAAYKAMLFQAQTERDVARATVCTSPWEDSPPCTGIQRQLDKIAALEVLYDTLEKVAKAVAHTWKKSIEDGGNKTENTEVLVATLDALAALVGEG